MKEPAKKACQVIVAGSVQGVFFRASAKEKAEKLELNGFARNEPDGSVTIEVEGEAAAIKEFIDWCKSGPKYAEVTEIETKDVPPQHYANFSIL